MAAAARSAVHAEVLAANRRYVDGLGDEGGLPPPPDPAFAAKPFLARISPAQDFTLSDTQGHEQTSSAAAGEVRLISFIYEAA